MKITRPDGSSPVDVSKKWEIHWEDVVEGEPQYAKFWLTHTSSAPYRNPVQLTGAINIHEQSHVEIDGKHFDNMPTGGGYRVWAMRVEEDPGFQPSPICESHDIEIENEEN